MIFPKTLCDDISSSDYGATDKAFSPSPPLPLFGNSNNWFGVHSPRGPHGHASFFLAMVESPLFQECENFKRIKVIVRVDNYFGKGQRPYNSICSKPHHTFTLGLLLACSSTA
ncbi:hypothetical protein AVEN_140963-1 [Araneus ventricosus]|uniref:Uncharacterized protein n=1 Tax=Araneus ventricosus TaxID=182803 RepID=A0A4Y2LLG1_ARAVE|nr:hypothetical protein AVEN_140963-1 [Araneus ventricosus]